jgi:hypothetical protein
VILFKQKVEIATLPSVARDGITLLEVIAHQQVARDEIDLMKRSSDLLARRVKDADFKKMGTVPFFRGVYKKSADFMNNPG